MFQTAAGRRGQCTVGRCDVGGNARRAWLTACDSLERRRRHRRKTGRLNSHACILSYIHRDLQHTSMLIELCSYHKCENIDTTSGSYFHINTRRDVSSGVVNIPQTAQDFTHNGLKSRECDADAVQPEK